MKISSIEKQKHWVLGVQFGEDDNRTRKDHSPENLALIRRVALNLFNNNGPSKDSLRRRKLRACLSDRYRVEPILGKNGTWLDYPEAGRNFRTSL